VTILRRRVNLLVVCLLIGAVGSVVCKCTFESLVCVHTVVETGAFETVVCKCAFEAAFEAFEYVRVVAETGAFEATVFECTFKAAFEAFTCMHPTVRLRC